MAALALTACGTPVDYGSDYLGSDAGLAKVESREEARRPANANLKPFTKVFIAPVELRFIGRSPLDADDAARVGTYFRQAVMMAVSDSYTIVGEAEPGTLTIRPALTGLIAGHATGSQGDEALQRSLSLRWATLEADIRDSISGKRMGAYVDHNVLPANTPRRLTRWDDVRALLDGWAKRFRRQFDTLRTASIAQRDWPALRAEIPQDLAFAFAFEA